MTVVDEFCSRFLKEPGDVYKKFNEFTDEKNIKLSFEEAKDCVETAAKLKNIDEHILNEYKKILEVNEK